MKASIKIGGIDTSSLLVVCIISCWKHEELDEKIIEKWTKVGIPFFIARGRRGDNSKVAVRREVKTFDCGDNWEDLPEKVVAAIAHAGKNYSYIFKIDDTSEIDMRPYEIRDILLNTIRCNRNCNYMGSMYCKGGENFRSKYHFGKVHMGNRWFNKPFESIKQPPYWAGGRGYLIRTDVFLQKIKTWGVSPKKINDIFIYEDAMVGHIMQDTVMTNTLLSKLKFSKSHIRELDMEEIITFLEQYRVRKNIVVFPGDGNAGDSLIMYGVYHALHKAGITGYDMCTWSCSLKNKTIICSGSGNLVGKYKQLRTFLQNNADLKFGNEIILLPQTISNEDKLISSFGSNITVMCRERQSHAYVHSLMKNKSNIFLSHDMAFHISDDLSSFRNTIPNKRCMNVIRTCLKESTLFPIPGDNDDLSFTLNRPGNTSDVKICKSVCLDMFRSVAQAEHIVTNRLHVGIAAALIGRKVDLYPSNYWKIPRVWEYSMENRFPNVTMHMQETPSK
jgi:exopolysaccharide biosynthesis predicted pyruvyltransferase EpsI